MGFYRRYQKLVKCYSDGTIANPVEFTQGNLLGWVETDSLDGCGIPIDLLNVDIIFVPVEGAGPFTISTYYGATIFNGGSICAITKGSDEWGHDFLNVNPKNSVKEVTINGDLYFDGSNPLYGLINNNTPLEKLTINGSIYTDGGISFIDTPNLKYIDFSKITIKTIDNDNGIGNDNYSELKMNQSFENSGIVNADLSLITFNGPEYKCDVKMIGMFKNCKNLTSLKFPTFFGNQSVDLGSMLECFYGCGNLIEADLSSYHTTYGNFKNCFLKNYKLQNLKLPTIVIEESDKSLIFTNFLYNETYDETVGSSGPGGVLESFSFPPIEVRGTSNPVIHLDLYHAFEYNANLKTVDFSNFENHNVNLDYDDTLYNTFAYCPSLEEIDMSCLKYGTLKELMYVFEDDTSLKKVVLPEQGTTLTNQLYSVFSGCKSLTTIVNWDKITFVGQRIDNKNPSSIDFLFSGCESLTSIDLSNFSGVLSARYLFDGCRSLTNITMPSSASICDFTNMFSGCTSLQSVDLTNCSYVPYEFTLGTNNNVIKHGLGYLFDGCENLETIVGLPFLGTTTTYEGIGTNYLFRNCKKLTELDFTGWNRETFITDGYTNHTWSSGWFTGCDSLDTIKCSASFKGFLQEFAVRLDLPQKFREGGNGNWIIS